MNVDFSMIEHLLPILPYPISKSQIVDFARQRGLNEQVLGFLDKLPDITFSSADDVKQKLAILNNFNIGNFFSRGGN